MQRGNGLASVEAPLAVPMPATNAASVIEGTEATGGTLTFTVALSSASQHQVTVGCVGTGMVMAGTSGKGYVALTADTLTFAAGDAGRTVDVTVAGDATDEPDETVVVRQDRPATVSA